jgi:hypothetical protein
MADIVTNRAMNGDCKNMSTFNTYCGILSTCHNYKNKSLSLIEFFVGIIIFNQVNQASEIKDYAIKTKILLSVD